MLQKTVATVATVLFGLAAFGLRVLHDRGAYSEPERTTSALFAAFAQGTLSGVQQASSGDWFAAFVRHFGEARFQRGVQAYDRIARLGRGRWSDLRQRSEVGASSNYFRLRERAYSLGTDAFRRLPADEAFALTQNDAAFEAYRWSAGLAALPPDDRQRLGTPEEVRGGDDYRRFIEREAWNSLSPTEQAELGASAALSTVDTPEKLAFLDRVGLTLAGASLKAEVRDFKRAELNDPDTFRFKYGWASAEQYLKGANIPGAVNITGCKYPAEELTGSLLKGTSAYCSAEATTAGGTTGVTVVLERAGHVWLVSRVTPMPYEVW